MSDFVHLHLHTEYSLLDGATRIDKVFDLAKEKGMSAVAITDHGNMFGTLYFAEQAKKHKMQGIIGCELYACDNYLDKSGRENTDHLILLCKNKKGYKNLIKLDSIAYVDGLYYKPRIDYNLLKQYSEGLVCLSACLAGRVAKRLLQNDYDGAKDVAIMLRDIFKDDFYLEIQDHGLAEQKYINPMLIKLAKELNIHMVATNDVHYLTRDDAEIQDVVMCISTKATIDDPKRMKMNSSEMYLKSPEEMSLLFSYLPEAIKNTVEIAKKCNEEPVFDLDDKCEPIRDVSLIPGYVPDDGTSPYEYLKNLALKGLRAKYPEITKEIQDRFDYELEVISSMGFCDYYLIVWDFINFAKSVDIPVGAGRGSGVSSIIAYAIGITDVEPLKYSLIFERFLNKERISMPDFDVDISDARRSEVVEYVRAKYGKDRVAQIVTFGTLASKAAIKDVGRVFKIPYGDINRITKLMDGKSTITESLGLKNNKEGINVGVRELIEIYEEDPNLKKIIDIAIKVEGLPRNTSMHAAGVVICAKPISDSVPLQRNGNDITTQFDMTEVEQLGMLKMDFLGLRTLTDIQLAEKYVEEEFGIKLDFHELGYEDQGAYELIGAGETDAVFQLESPGMKKFMRDLKPTTFEDIIAGISLYRPGPMDSIPSYIKYKHHPEAIVYDTPLLKPILQNSYGTLIYQEQVMQICQSLGGFSMGQADIVRKAMGKKKVDVMAKQKIIFINGGVNEHTGEKIEGAVKRGVPPEAADKIFDNMASFAKYAFNKSHAAAYAVLAYQTAYLKRYYPNQFLTSILNNRIDKIEEVSKYLLYLRTKNIPIYPPDINMSRGAFHCEKDGIRFGLSAIKNVGSNTINAIVDERNNNGLFKSFEDFLVRCIPCGLNKRLIENLIYAGAFDMFNHTRAEFINVYAELYERALTINKERTSDQISFFGEIIKDDSLSIKYPVIKEYSSNDKLSKEKAILGVYVTGHPLNDFIESFNKFSFNTSLLEYFDEDEDGNKTFTEIKDGDSVTIGGIINGVEKLATKKGDTMAFLKLEDIYGQIECVFFPKNYEKNKNLLIDEQIVKICGKLQFKDNTVQILADKVENYEIKQDEKFLEKAEQENLGIIIREDIENKLNDILDIITSYPGEINVIISKNGKKFSIKEKVRKCDGLLTELYGVVKEEDIIFFKKKL